MKRKNVKQTAVALLAERGQLSSGELAAAVGVTRQAAHHALSGLVDDGLAERHGRGRGSHYVAASHRSLTRRTAGLEEHDLWNELRRTPEVRVLDDPALAVMHYAVSEMVNNAIDHSGSKDLTVLVASTDAVIDVVVEDNGVGVFEKVRSALALDGHYEALEQLSKGKLTTDPQHHTGEGIFFTSKAVDSFRLDANGVEWTVDNVNGDVAVGTGVRLRGTAVGLRHGIDSSRRIEDVFSRFTTDLAFDASHVVVKLFEHGETFVSRSEARRVVAGLEKFARVEVDFAGVTRVGQGFVDEVFRVWGAAHPETSLTPINMVEPVAFMVLRGLPEQI